MRTPGLVLLALLPVLPAQQPPNIVVLFADDAGFADFGFQPQRDPAFAELTPHIDSIAAGGARFSSFTMAGCVCSPSRAGLMTGRYPQRFGHERNIPPGYMKGGMAKAEHTVADRLRALGYRTGLVGKWHLGYPQGYQPNDRGFDWFYGLLQGSRSYWPYEQPTAHRVIQENGEPTPEEGYVTDRFGAAAVRFLEESKQAEQPFFLFLSFTAPHGPMHGKQDDLAALESIPRKRRRIYAAMVKAMDDNVGRVLDALQRLGLEQNTLVVFTNDNGGQTSTGARNAPLRGKKGTLWEGGVRVPFCLRWPGVVAAGSVVDDPASALDLLPTFVAAAGGEVDPEWQLDGIDLGARLRGDAAALPARALFWRSDGPSGPAAVRRGSNKLLILDRGVASQLYDLTADLAEQRDLAAERPELAASLAAELAAWEAELVEPLWGGNRRRARSKKD